MSGEKEEQIVDPGILQAMDDIAKLVEVMTGVKNQFIGAGWDERMAEAISLKWYRKIQPVMMITGGAL